MSTEEPHFTLLNGEGKPDSPESLATSSPLCTLLLVMDTDDEASAPLNYGAVIPLVDGATLSDPSLLSVDDGKHQPPRRMPKRSRLHSAQQGAYWQRTAAASDAGGVSTGSASSQQAQALCVDYVTQLWQPLLIDVPVSVYIPGGDSTEPCTATHLLNVVARLVGTFSAPNTNPSMYPPGFLKVSFGPQDPEATVLGMLRKGGDFDAQLAAETVKFSVRCLGSLNATRSISWKTAAELGVSDLSVSIYNSPNSFQSVDDESWVAELQYDVTPL